MSEKTIVINLTKLTEMIVDNRQDIYVKRQQVADNANALLLALNGGPEAAGVIMLARSLGCVEK